MQIVGNLNFTKWQNIYNLKAFFLSVLSLYTIILKISYGTILYFTTKSLMLKKNNYIQEVTSYLTHEHSRKQQDTQNTRST